MCLHNSTALESRCIRVRLYSSQQKKREVAFIDDEVDFPLEPNGGLNLRRVKLYWGINLSAPLEPYSWKLFKPCKHDQLSGVAVHNLSDGRRNLIELLFNPIESDEYKREELGTWRRELKWRRRVLADDPVWYMNRLVALCFLWWLLSLIPEALGAAWSAAVALLVTASLAVQWARSLMLSVPSRARTQSF
ncbi:hypothetical protein BC834DRAFT_276887 [Gloeopeniophorella convolvens]|nr:hypothetical protein BC834DRAFT_276887 [Gloeopeniophorella convolvens]